MSLSYALKVVKLLPMAIRVSAAGGVAYGSVRVGAWSTNTQDSRETLDQLQREIQYPATGKLLLPSSDGSLTSQVVDGWNHAVRTVFLTLTGDRGGLQLETLSSLRVGLKRWGSEIGKTVTGNKDEKP